MYSLQHRALTDTGATCLVIKPSVAVPDLCEDVRRGLLSPPRSLPPKYFYDARGAQLFDRICATPEYYPTRVEDALLRQYADNIISETRPAHIIELGSGACTKTRRLFDACEQLRHQCSYAPFDVCKPVLMLAAHRLKTAYEWLDVTPMLGDYHGGLANLPAARGTNLILFLGSTIGNFTPPAARSFIRDLRRSLTDGDYLLIGADRVKDSAVLNAAYNDTAGITAQFNLNVLRVLNRELRGNFDLHRFRHQAGFNAAAGRIEMHLLSLEEQEISLHRLQAAFKLAQGETILTEISHKFEAQAIESLVLDCGFELVRHYQPDNQYFSLVLACAG